MSLRYKLVRWLLRTERDPLVLLGHAIGSYVSASRAIGMTNEQAQRLLFAVLVDDTEGFRRFIMTESVAIRAEGKP